MPVAYVPLEGEGHGFRKAENIIRTLEAELYFYQRVFQLATPQTARRRCRSTICPPEFSFIPNPKSRMNDPHLLDS